jgi:predicted secreted protein
MSNAFVPIGTQLQIGDQHSGETFTAVSEVNRISGFGWSRNMVEITSLDSTGGYREYLPTFRDGQVITVDMNMTVANWDKFRDIFETEDDAAEALDYRLVVKAGTTTKYTWEFNAFVQSIKLGDIDFNNKLSMTVELRITGVPVETSGA